MAQVSASDGLPQVAASRDEASEFEALFVGSCPLALSLAIRVTGNFADAADAVQDAAVSAWQRRGQRQGAFEPWFLAIVFRCARHSRRRWLRLIRPVSSMASQAGSMSAELEDAWGRLPQRQSLCLWLRFGQDMTYVAAGQVMGISEAAAKQLCQRALRNLRERLVTPGGEGS